MDGKKYFVFLGFWKYFPVRLKRLIGHIVPGLRWNYRMKDPPWWLWPVELLILFFDLLGFPDFIMQVRLIVNKEIRKLTHRERVVIERFYGQVSFIERVWMNPRDSFHFRKWAHAYVFHDSINYYHSISESILIHEFMHVIQYHMVGSVYIVRALIAQKSKKGYQYGNAISLYNDMIFGKNLWDYNYEQQAQIMQDYFELSTKDRITASVINSGFQAMLWHVKEEVVKL